jgi:hypothetical protein
VRHDLPDIYDDRPLRGQRPPSRTWPWVFGALVILAVGVTWWYIRREPAAPAAKSAAAPVRVVRDRPGGKIDEAKAALILRRHFAPRIADQCLATIMNGASGHVYRFTVVDSCNRTRLGQWQVDGATGAVLPRR